MAETAKVYPIEASRASGSEATGFTRVPNQMADILCRVELSGRQYRVLMAIIRKLLGFNKTTDWLAPAQIADQIGYSGDLTNIRADMRELERRNIISRTGKSITINTRYGQWEQTANRSKSIRKEIDINPPETDRNRSAHRSKSIRQQIETNPKTDRNQHPQKKDNYSKDTITKNKAPDLSVVPEWLSLKTVEEFIDHRKSIKKPLTQKALTLLIGKLDSFRSEGHDPIVCLEESIMNGWQGVFRPKGGATAKQRRRFDQSNYEQGLEGFEDA
ncbi:replication protein [Marinobacterium sp. D7]|uniref:replication protein n=1 Tax=Marinobacterium ramblicola TaxID=2849041 RepID=UPI001C2D9AFC|nr:replication protein [Marinobacterium ramblicola]